MRHRKASLKLNRTSSHRDAMFRNMATSLFKYKRIRTTSAKARELSRWADHLITLAKKGDLHSRRQVLSIIREKNVVHKLFEEANDQYGERPGGHTRIIKIGRRAGDAAPLSLIELIGKTTEAEKTTKKKKAPQATKKEETIKTEEKKSMKEKEPSAKTEKTVEPKKKKAAKKKVAAKKPVTEKKEKKTAPEEKKKEKKEKTAGKKKAVKAKKKAAPKKAKEKKEK